MRLPERVRTLTSIMFPREDHGIEQVLPFVENEKATRQKVTSSFKGE
jgi:hypothetical protein